MIDEQDGKTENASSPIRLVGKTTEASTQHKRQATLTRDTVLDKNALDIYRVGGEPEIARSWGDGYLLNGASPEMNANGSLAVPVLFTYTPTQAVEYLESINMLIIENATSSDPLDYGAVVGPLANGVLLEIRSQGVTFALKTLLSNIDLITFFNRHPWATPTGSGILNFVDVYSGEFNLRYPLKLQQSTGDFVRASVRDNLTAVDFHRMGVKVWR